MKRNQTYEEFLDKFKHKLTTDDCYTPENVYEAILGHLKLKTPESFRGRKIMRPFYPGGDFEKEDYTNAIVFDNPPFSIISKIKNFYEERDIPYFLFAPHLIVFNIRAKNLIVVGASIVFSNSARINISFISNLFGVQKIIVDGGLYQKIKDAQSKLTSLPKYSYPSELLSASKLGDYAKYGYNFSIKSNEVKFIRALDSQKPLKKNIFGGGALTTFKLQKLEKLKRLNTFIFPLSAREKQILEYLK
jgi:hypothetical protein